ncbi:MAG: bile acid:sodium symporter family protein [Planctomycetaceae bacterium]
MSDRTTDSADYESTSVRRATMLAGTGLLAAAFVSAAILTVSLASGRTSWVAPSLTGMAISLAVASSVLPRLRPKSFTIWTIATVILGMSYPAWFIGIGDFEFTRLFVPILQVIMFGMGTTLSIADFARVARMPWGILVGVTCQFSIMPMVGFLLAHAMGLPPEIAAGMILVGVSPSGLASNVMSYIAKANVAMSVTMTAATTLIAPILTPVLMHLLAGEMIAIDVPAMMLSMAKIVLIPVLGGLVFHHLFYHRFHWLDRVMPLISMTGIIVLTVLTVATGRDNLMQMGLLLIGACLLHCVAGFTLGYVVCRLLDLDLQTCRTISLEVGLQNAGLASGLAKELNRVATLGLAPIVFGPVMNTVASIIANWWRTHPVPSPHSLSAEVSRTEDSDSEPVHAAK